MPRDLPRATYRRDGEGESSRYGADRRYRSSRQEDDHRRGPRPDRDDGHGRDGGEPSRRYGGERVRDRNGRRREDDAGMDRARDRYRVGDRDGDGDRDGGRDGDGDRDRDRDRDGDRDMERGYGRGRGREDDRRRVRVRDDRDRDRDLRRAGPSRRSASPRLRSSQPGSRSRSRSAAAEDKAKPNFAPSGLLAAATKTVEHGDGTKTVLKYHEPPEARKPTVGWRLYVFKGKEQVDLLHIQRQSAYLVGRDRAVVDIAVDHPSCSKQHAVIQYRQVQEKNEFGDVKATVKPFIIDLESTNGTIINDAPIPTSRYFELMAGDVIKFGESAREYVLLSEDAA